MKKALLIGINDYPEGNELTGCIEDINSVKAALNDMVTDLLTLA